MSFNIFAYVEEWYILKAEWYNDKTTIRQLIVMKNIKQNYHNISELLAKAG